LNEKRNHFLAFLQKIGVVRAQTPKSKELTTGETILAVPGMRRLFVKIAVRVCDLVVNRRADAIICNAKINVQEGNVRSRNCVRKLKGRVEIGHKVDVVVKL